MIITMILTMRCRCKIMLEKESIEKEFETIRDKVLYLLEIDEESRNSDIRLLCKYLSEFTSYRIVNIDGIIPLLNNIEKAFSQNLGTKDLVKHSITALKFKLSQIPRLSLFPSSESIRRVRQKLQNDEELFIPTILEIAEKRNIRAKLIREYFIEKKIMR